MKNKRVFIFFILSIISLSLLYAMESYYSSQPHNGSVLSMAPTRDETGYYSAGADGFLVKWDDSGNGDHYQVSDLPIKLIAVHPIKDEVAIYESDGFSINRISVWNWQTKKRKFAKRFTDTISTLTYSTKGTWLMVGTTSINGMIFLDSNSGNQKRIIKEPTGLITLAVSSATESSLITYSPSGLITYIDLKTGNTKTSFPTISDLVQPILHNNNLYLSGIKNNTIFTVSATTGKTVHEIPADNPLLITYADNMEPRYITCSPNQFSIHNADQIVGNFIIPSFDTKTLTAIVATKKAYYAGDNKGSLYQIIYEDNDTLPVKFFTVTQDTRMKILDVAASGDWYYFLTEKGIYRSTGSENDIQLITSMTGKNITTDGENLILWSKNETVPLILISGENLFDPKQLYVPKRPIQSLSVYSDKIVFIENMNLAAIYDVKSEKIIFSYKGTSFQDAVLLNDKELIIAKTSALGSHSPALHINITTGETVMLPFTGDVAFSLKTIPTDPGNFFGLLITTDNDTKKTELYEYDTLSNTYYPLIVWADEDTNAFIYPTQKYIYTNIGKGNIMLINRENHKQYLLARSNALPAKITGGTERLLVLNSDGSISWYNKKNNTHIGNWYITKENSWYAM